jgi:hypothetical protein
MIFVLLSIRHKVEKSNSGGARWPQKILRFHASANLVNRRNGWRQLTDGAVAGR